MPNDARVGDLTSHGGVIITGSGKFIDEGKPTARIGDLHACPIHGVNPIVSGAAKFLEGGRPMARIGDVTACGAVIVTGAAKMIIGS